MPGPHGVVTPRGTIADRVPPATGRDGRPPARAAARGWGASRLPRGLAALPPDGPVSLPRARSPLAQACAAALARPCVLAELLQNELLKLLAAPPVAELIVAASARKYSCADLRPAH